MQAMSFRTPPAFRSTRLLDQVRERARFLHYSLRTEKAYLYWVRFFIRWHGLKHPRDMGAREVEAFLTMLANERRASASTHSQALSALLFVYREVLGVDLPWLQELRRPRGPSGSPPSSRRRRCPACLRRSSPRCSSPCGFCMAPACA